MVKKNLRIKREKEQGNNINFNITERRFKDMEINGHKETEKIKVSLANEGTVNKNSVVLQTEKGSIKLFFSYNTIISFRSNSDNATIKNYWSSTTGKFLNELEADKNARIGEEEFKKRLRTALNGLF